MHILYNGCDDYEEYEALKDAIKALNKTLEQDLKGELSPNERDREKIEEGD